MNCRSILGMVLATVMGAGHADAAVTAIDLVPHAEGAGFDVTLDFTGQYTGSQFILELTQGEIRFDADDLFGLAGVEGQSFISLGSATPSWAARPSIAGAAVNLDSKGARTPTLTESAWDIAVYAGISQFGPSTQDQTDFLTARFVLSPDAQGTLDVFASATAEDDLGNGHNYFVGSTDIVAGLPTENTLSRTLPVAVTTGASTEFDRPTNWGYPTTLYDEWATTRSYLLPIDNTFDDGWVRPNRSYVWLLNDGFVPDTRIREWGESEYLFVPSAYTPRPLLISGATPEPSALVLLSVLGLPMVSRRRSVGGR